MASSSSERLISNVPSLDPFITSLVKMSSQPEGLSPVEEQRQAESAISESRNNAPINYRTMAIRNLNQWNAPQGLFLVTSGENADTDIVFVHVWGGHPWKSWTDQDVVATADPGKSNAYFLHSLATEAKHCRTWTFGYRLPLDDTSPFATAAAHLLNAITVEKFRMPDSMSQIVFISINIGSFVVKEVLIRATLSSSDEYNQIVTNYIGVVFITAAHSFELRSSPAIQHMGSRYDSMRKIWGPSRLRDSHVPDFEAAVREGEDINIRFVAQVSQMPATLSIINTRRSPTNLSRTDGVFPAPRTGLDESFKIDRSDPYWERKIGPLLSQEHLVFGRISLAINKWRSRKTLQITDTPDVQVGPKFVNLLSIDSGGVRGLSSLLILRAIMEKLRSLRESQSGNTKSELPKPADVFDLAGGTSTGGLICIMLFRLRMDIHGAIEQYKNLSPKIFRESFSSNFGGNVVKSIFGKPWFPAEPLEAGIKEIVKYRLPEWELKDVLEGDPTNVSLLSEPTSLPPDPQAEKMFVCASLETETGYEAIRLRSYSHPEAEYPNCKIWEAARATSAAPFYFPMAKIEGDDFIDGGLVYNNPAMQVWVEAKDIFGEQPLNSVISLGTGVATVKPKKSCIPVLGKGKKILKTLKNTELEHQEMEKICKHSNTPYFRFNPSTGKDKIGLADYKLLDALEKLTLQFLEQEEVKKKILRCAELLDWSTQHNASRPGRDAI